MIDTAEIRVKAGNGGNGSLSFRRAKFMPKGGPDGGDGGNGGSVYFVGDKDMNTLQLFMGKQKFEATAGGDGTDNKKHGANGKDLEIKIPLGCIITIEKDETKTPPNKSKKYTAVDLAAIRQEAVSARLVQPGIDTTIEPDEEGSELEDDELSEEQKPELEPIGRGREEVVTTTYPRVVSEVLEDGQRFCIAKGGRGGRGNVHFKSSTNQTPMFAEWGKYGQEFVVKLELKLLANVGLVGFPNAGKSSLLASLTKARPEIANYPFTTLSPNLGVVLDDSELRSLVLADIPGLIEGAGMGKGLGHEFLKHVERCSVLLMVLAIDDAVLYDAEKSAIEKAASLKDAYSILRKELGSYNEDLLKKPEIICINKIDLYDEELRKAIMTVFPKAMFISAATHEGLDELKKVLFA